MKQAFNKIGVIGDFNTWGGDVDMTWNPYYSRFYADVEFAADGGFKFRTDADWAVNYGDNGADGALDMGGDNIAVTAGKYRVYLYFNDSNAYTYYLDDAAYGTEEPTEPEPEPEPEPIVENAWSLIGAIAGSTWDKDFYMTEADGVWTSAVVNITGEFKIRFNNDWAVNRGGALVSLGEPFAVTQDGSNIVVPAAGYYKVVYDSTKEAITVTSYANHFSLIGEIAGTAWDTDFFMEETATGVWKSEKVAINGGFKVRYNCDWGVNYGAGGDVEPFVVTLGEAFAAVAGGKNLGVPTANAEYYVTYNDNDKTIMVEAALPSNQWSLIGGIEGSSWDKDFVMTETANGVWETSAIVNGEFKIRNHCSWDYNRGGDLVTLGTAFAVTPGGPNIKVPTVDAKYKVVYKAAEETVTVTAQ